MKIEEGFSHLSSFVGEVIVVFFTKDTQAEGELRYFFLSCHPSANVQDSSYFQLHQREILVYRDD